MRRTENRLRQQKREDRRAVSGGGGQPAWQKFRNPMSPLAVLDDGELALIDDVALRILEELGLEFQNRETFGILERHGAMVDRATGMVRFERGLIRELVAKAPESFTLHARNPERTLTMGGNWINFAPVGGPPNVSDLDRGRRKAAISTFIGRRSRCRIAAGTREASAAGAWRTRSKWSRWHAAAGARICWPSPACSASSM